MIHGEVPTLTLGETWSDPVTGLEWHGFERGAEKPAGAVYVKGKSGFVSGAPSTNWFWPNVVGWARPTRDQPPSAVDSKLEAEGLGVVPGSYGITETEL